MPITANVCHIRTVTLLIAHRGLPSAHLHRRAHIVGGFAADADALAQPAQPIIDRRGACTVMRHCRQSAAEVWNCEGTPNNNPLSSSATCNGHQYAIPRAAPTLSPCSVLRVVAACRGHVGCSAQLQKDAPATAPRDDTAAKALEVFGLRNSPQQVYCTHAKDARQRCTVSFSCCGREQAARVSTDDASQLAASSQPHAPAAGRQQRRADAARNGRLTIAAGHAGASPRSRRGCPSGAVSPRAHCGAIIRSTAQRPCACCMSVGSQLRRS